MNIDQLIDFLREDDDFTANVASWIKHDKADGEYRDYPEYIDERLIEIYKQMGIEKLYSHQREACDIIHRGENAVIVTPTASGKTLCYNLPVLDSVIKDYDKRALYLFPTKALSQDQMNELQGIISKTKVNIKTYTFDGDTPVSARKAIRAAGNIVITNPDMLHAGILPHHTIWVKLFENLEFVVLDEIHGYRGIFGSHFANLIRRLHRICAFYGSNPRFICCSATIFNPQEHAEKLTGRKFRLVDNNGAPRGEKHYILYNPPVVNEQLGIRASAVKESSKVAALFLQNNIPTIVFARSRLRVEIISTYLRDTCKNISRKIAGYRGGYLPNERRAIERGLREGRITGVVSTNALELGIDIGMLDAAVTVGYPGSISSLYQQLGRAGRRGNKSIALMIASSSPLDQYIIGHNEFLVQSNPETANINPDNLLILMDHIKCAAFELPFAQDERFASHLSTTREMLEYLEEMGVLKKSDEKFHWMNETYPANDISLRTAAPDNFLIIDKNDQSRVIGEIDYYAAPTLVHEDAIYIHQGKQYYIDQLDWERRTAYCHEVDTGYFTDAETKTDLHVLENHEEIRKIKSILVRGEINVRYKTVMFKKIKFNSHENLGWGKIHLPEQEMHTTAMWIDFDEEYLLTKVGKPMIGKILYSIAYVFSNIAPLYTFSDYNDIRVIHQTRSNYSGSPAIFMYDNIPGGVGISDRIFSILGHILDDSIKVVSDCVCPAGCPGCIGPIPSENDNGKKQVISVLRDLLNEHQGKA